VVSKYGAVKTITMTAQGDGYTTATARISSNTGQGAVLTPVITDGKITSITIVDGGYGYRDGAVVIEGDGFPVAVADVVFATNIDNVESYGDNNSFKKEAVGLVFDTNNPFGDT
jgi:hypothetical protein